MHVKEILEEATKEFQTSKKALAKLKKTNNRQVDVLFHKQHDKVFAKTDCLKCANCCKTTSPIFRDVDVKRIAKKMRMSVRDFEATYLRMDEERDLVLKSSPCAFLEEDNTCSIYEDRPLACREYPHTNRKNMYQILDLTLKNTLVCPAVFTICQEIQKESTR